jgi:5'-3' exonuclease
MSRLRKRFLDTHNMTLAEAQNWGGELLEQQRDIMFWIGDLARYAEARWPDTHQQIWPEWVSPGLLSRAAGVCRAYPKFEDREAEATYSQYMQVASKPDRLARLAGIVDAGQTTDESRQAEREEKANGGARWLLAVDVNYFLHRFWFSGAGVEAAVGVATWVQRTVNRLKEKGLTDCACCFDSKSNHRKEFTKDWEDKYKDRPQKDPELVQQLNLVYDLLTGAGFACVGLEGFEADDVMASYAKQFQGRVTLLTQDKDCRQCLSEKCNMLLDVEWQEDETSGEHLPEYKWLSMKQHTEATGIPPSQWIDYQVIMGDATDGIKGAVGIGEKGSADLVKQFGTVEAAIAAAKAGEESIRAAKRQSLIDFEAKLEVTRKLVTLRTDLEIPSTTRI